MNFYIILLLTHLLTTTPSINGDTKLRFKTEIGKSVIIPCGSTGDATWTREGGLPQKDMVLSEGLYIPSVNYSDAGLYLCRLGDRDHGKTVQIALKIMNQDLIDPVLREVKLHHDTQFVCLSDSSPRWSFRRSGKQRAWPANAVAYGKVLKISKAVPQNEGIYECEGIADLYEFIARGELRVYKEDISRTSPVNQKIYEGQEAAIFCTSESEVQWTFNGSNLPSNTRITAHHTLLIEQAHMHNQGYYECKGIGKHTFHSQSYVKVLDKPPRPIILKPSDGPPMYEPIEPGYYEYYKSPQPLNNSLKLTNFWPVKPKSALIQKVSENAVFPTYDFSLIACASIVIMVTMF